MTITFDPKADPSRPGDLAAATAAVTRTLQGLVPGLGGCGSPSTGWPAPPTSPAWSAAPTTRRPAARSPGCWPPPAPARADVPPLTWLDAGPVGAQELSDRYQHDSGISVSWAWHEAPRQAVTSAVLARLASPGPFTKRLALQFRPLPAAAASRAIETEVNAASFRATYRRKTGRDATARDEYDSARASQAAAEEASGAGVVLIGLYCTVTVTDAGDLDRAVAATEAAAEASRIRLRRMWNSQAAGFTATLPCGACPPELARRWPR